MVTEREELIAKARLVRLWSTVGRWLLLGIAAVLLIPAPVVKDPICWEELLVPLQTGAPLVRGYVFSSLRRGEAQDVVLSARRETGALGALARVEIHLVDRGQWSGIEETRSFGIAWEVPPAASPVKATEEEARAVTDVVREAVARNDTGFDSVAAIPLRSEAPAPLIARTLDRLRGWRGVVIGGAVAAWLPRLASWSYGGLLAVVILLAIGGVLRLSALSFPFLHDQDVQRALTGNLPLTEILLGAGLRDRHPPLYFVVLHFVQYAGQSAQILRLPAAIAGTLIGPGMLWATSRLKGRIGITALGAALAVTLSPELIGRSREVSEIPLYTLIVMTAATSLVAALRSPRWSWWIGLALSHTLALFTYYLAPFFVVAHAGILLGWRWAQGRLERGVVVAWGLGVALGLPILAVGMITFFRDRGAREVARVFPGLAWGDHSLMEMVSQMSRVSVDAFGMPLLLLLFVAVGRGLWKGQLAVITLAAGAAATFFGIALLAPLARVQAYYITTVLPLLALAAAQAPPFVQRQQRHLWRCCLLATLAASTLPALSRGRSLYVDDVNAFMPRFALMIRQRPETRVVTVAHYDKTLLAYYLAQAEGKTLSWFTLDEASDKRIEPLLMVHDLGPDSEARAIQDLERLMSEAAILVIERDSFLLPNLHQRLRACETLAEAPTARLFRCAADSAITGARAL